MVLTLRTLDQTERRFERAHRTSVGARRPAHARNGSCADARILHAQTHRAKQPEGDRALPLASPPPSRGRGIFCEPAPESRTPPAHSAAIWREMMSRWMSDVPS